MTLIALPHTGAADLWDLMDPGTGRMMCHSTWARCAAWAAENGYPVRKGTETEYAKLRGPMNLTTTRLAPKPFTWSYSRLKNFEACPKKHYHVDILKDAKEDESEQLTYGNELHKAIAERLDKKKPLPKPYEFMEPWAVRVENGPGQLLVEQKLAITKDFKPTGYFDRDVWFRGVADVLRVAGKVALVMDWKTGKIVEDSVQLALTAQCIFSHYPEVMRVRSEFIWLKEDATTRGDFSREDMVGLWAGLIPRIEGMVVAANTTTYPAKPGGLCRRYCPVTKCPHHGVG